MGGHYRLLPGRGGTRGMDASIDAVPKRSFVPLPVRKRHSHRSLQVSKTTTTTTKCVRAGISQSSNLSDRCGRYRQVKLERKFCDGQARIEYNVAVEPRIKLASLLSFLTNETSRVGWNSRPCRFVCALGRRSSEQRPSCGNKWRPARGEMTQMSAIGGRKFPRGH